MVAIEQASIQKNCAISFQRNAEAGGPTVTQMQPPPAATAPSKQVVPRAKGKQISAPVPQPQQTTVVVAEPPAPALSESDRTMNNRN